MTQLCCYRVWDGSLERFRKAVLTLSFFDLLIISTLIIYVAITLYNVSFVDPPPDADSGDVRSKLFDEYNETESSENETAPCGSNETGEDVDCSLVDMSNHLNKTARFFPVTPYFQVVGYQIAKSIQLIIYTVQLFITVFLIRSLWHNDTQCMRTWLIVTEIITTIVLFVLVIYLFGDFKAHTVLILGAYLIYQFIMIRIVARLIRRTEIELTQFGSIVEF